MEKTNFLISLVFLILVLQYVNATMPGSKSCPKVMKHFVLVHKSGHGAWSWYKIVALMRSSGHNVTAIDLGGSGINPKQALEIPYLSDYFSPLMKFMASLPAHEKVVLVGHSHGGFAISKAMETFPEKILVAIFVTALMPGPTLNASTVYTESFALTGALSAHDNHVIYDNGPTNPPTTFIEGTKYLANYVYEGSPMSDLALATTLIRPVYLYSVEDVSQEMVLSRKRYGSVRRVFVIAAKDNFFKKEFQQSMIEKNPPDEVKVIEDSDHMVMMSKPHQLFSLLMSVTVNNC